ncbi:MAG: retropepsin-like aspartic protease [Lutibacter sp.]|jgi:predicted aspartyl protease|nr:retropepsin-like aspartic protease [Lutibacter sp.]
MNLSKILARKGYIRIPLTKINTKHFELKGRINGVKGRFILDTGASDSCVADHLADKFGLEAEASDTQAAGAGASGMETKVSHKNTLCLNVWELRNVQLVLLDLSHVNQALEAHKAQPVDGIIGADLLERGKALIDYKGRCVYLQKKVYKY